MEGRERLLATVTARKHRSALDLAVHRHVLRAEQLDRPGVPSAWRRTELSDRGWAFGNRLTVYNEGLPEAGEQHRTKPIARDLDGKNGYSGRIRLQVPERAMIQLTRIDNRATLVPEVHGQTPWLTKFNVIGATLGTTGPTTLAAEWAYGWTEFAFPGGRFKMDFDSAYVLLSQKRGADRWTTRVDRCSRSENGRLDYHRGTSVRVLALNVTRRARGRRRRRRLS